MLNSVLGEVRLRRELPSWTNNALLASVIAAVVGVILAFIFGLLEPDAPELPPGASERRRIDAEQIVTDISEVRRQIDIVGRSIALGNASNEIAPSEAQQQYLNLRESQDRVRAQKRLTDLGDALQAFIDAYDAALTAADTAFDCAHNLLEVKQNLAGDRNLDIPITPHDLKAACPERIDLERGNPNTRSFSNVVAGLERCESELTSAAESIAIGDFELLTLQSCQEIPGPPALRYAGRLD